MCQEAGAVHLGIPQTNQRIPDKVTIRLDQKYNSLCIPATEGQHAPDGRGESTESGLEGGGEIVGIRVDKVESSRCYK